MKKIIVLILFLIMIILPGCRDMKREETEQEEVMSGEYIIEPMQVCNNGGYIIKIGNTFYWHQRALVFASKRCEGKLLRSAEGGDFEEIMETGMAESRLYSDGRYLYFGVCDEQIGEAVYRMDLQTLEREPFANGRPQYYDTVQKKLYIETDCYSYQDLDGIYCYDIEAEKISKILDYESRILAYGKESIYYTTDLNEIWRMDTADLKKELIVTEKSKNEDGYDRDFIYRLVETDDRIIYNLGHYSGSEGYYSGNSYSILKDGTDKRKYSGNSEVLYSAGNSIYVSSYEYVSVYKMPTELEEGKGYFCLSSDFSEENYVGDIIGDFICYDEVNHKIYYSRSEDGNWQLPNLYRCHEDGSGKKLLLEGCNLGYILEKESDRMSYVRIDIVDDKIYIETQSWGHRGYSGWRNDFLEQKIHLIHTDGVGMEELYTVEKNSQEENLRLKKQKILAERTADERENLDLWKSKLMVTDYRNNEIIIREYEEKEDFLKEYCMEDREPYFIYYDNNHKVQMELFYDEERRTGCGVRYVKEKEKDTYLMRGFVFDKTIEKIWEIPDKFSLKSDLGKSGEESVKDYQEDWELDERGKIVHYKSTGIMEFMGDTEPFSIIEINFTYREDGTLACKDCWYNPYILSSFCRRSFYDEAGRIFYEVTQKGQEYYYIYEENSESPLFGLLLDNENGFWIPEWTSY
ncbi:MAG: hypothetical protein J6C64_01595 [Lachnospiraceae bacterium]|nr:hypothetical protein [Lachnospiraceae bacterium]